MAKKVHILKDDADKTSMLTYGIVSSDSILQLSMLLNNHKNLNFQLTSPIIPQNSDTEKFACSKHEDEDTICYLIKNKENGRTLIKPYAQIDYLFSISGKNESEFFEELSTTLKSTGSVSVITNLDDKKLKNLYKLLSLK